MADKVQSALEKVKEAMKRNEYEIGNVVEVDVDPSLGFMGYSMPIGNGRYRIVVSGASVDSGMLHGLLAHELSHIYRMKTGHASHNGDLIEEAVNSFGRDVTREDYQEKFMHDILNDIQDLYADDIAFKVLRKAGYIPLDDISRFLQSWVKDMPDDNGRSARLSRWANGAILVHNARALAQMKRHNVPDKEGMAAKTSERFLSKMPGSMKRSFDYFQKTLSSLDEKITPEAYRTLLREYIGEFLEMVGEPAKFQEV